MKDQSLRVLNIEDSEDDALLIIRELKKGGYNPVYKRVETAAAMNKSLKEKHWDIILCDYKMPKFNAHSAIALLKEANIDIPLIVVTGKIGEETAAECMLVGAKDYIMKGNLSRLCPAIARELEDAEVRNKQNHMDEKLRREEQRFQAFVEHSLDIIVIMTIEGIVTYINPAIERVLGYKVEERIGANTLEVIHPDDLQYLADHVIILFTDANAPVVQFEVRLRHKDGSWRTFEAVGSNLVQNNVVEAVIVNYRDITERKWAEEDIKENERRYRLLTENMSDIVWIADMNLQTTYISPSIKNVLGFSQEERLRQNLDEQLTPHSLSLVLEALSREIALEEQGNADPDRTLKMELEYYHKDGSTRWMELLISGLRDDQDVLTRIYGVSRDITDRKLAEKALRESEERFRSMIQSLSDIIFILDANGQLTYESPSATMILGYQPGYFIGKSPFIHIHSDDLDQVMKDLDEVFLSTNPGIPTEFRYKKADDTWIYLEALGSNQFENPGIHGIVLTVRDISERKKAEDKLQQTLESLRKAVGTTIQVLVSAVESRDSYTSGHQSRSADLACAIATEMGLAPEKIEGIRMAGIIHDIGKLSIPAEILSKPTKLTEIEFALIKEHSRSGYEMLKDVESPWPLAEIVYQHHERINGSGYPRNLKGDEIVIESQILAVADVVEAMASHRPYRPTLGIEAALEEITKNKGILYNNAVADTCLRLFREKGYQLK
jgi:PAS domain S-box-containing protein